MGRRGNYSLNRGTSLREPREIPRGEEGVLAIAASDSCGNRGLISRSSLRLGRQVGLAVDKGRIHVALSIFKTRETAEHPDQ